jgi:hypothetical protein
VKHYLVIYDRRQGSRVGRLRSFRDSGRAINARFAAEREYRGQPDIEVVVLSGKSVDALRRTHGRYFGDAQQLARTALSRGTASEA